MPNLNDNFIESTFKNESFPGYEGTILNWNTVHRYHTGPMPTDHYTLRLDTFYTFDPSFIGSHPYLNDTSLSGRVYNESNYIASMDGSPKVVSIEEGLAPIDIKTFPFSIEDGLLPGQPPGGTLEATGIEFIARSLADKSNVLDMRLVAEWWHWTVPGWDYEGPLKGNEKNAFWQVATKNISENLYLSKPIISFPEDTIRPMEIYSKAHLISGSEDESSVLNAYSGWDKVAGVWFDENVNIQYSGKDRVIRTPEEKEESYSIYEVPDSGYQHYENEIYTKYKIVYSGEPANKYRDEREVSFTKNDGVVASVERKITRASSTGDFFDDWEVLSENATSPFVDSEIFSDYVSDNIPVEEEDVYEVVSHGDQDYVEIDIIPNTGWGENPSDKLPYCMKEDELFFEEGCNLRMRQEGGYDYKRQSFFSEVMVYFQDTNSFPISGYKVEFQDAPPDESRIYQLQNVADGLSDQDEVYFVGQAVGEGGSVGEAVYEPELFSVPQTDYEKEQGVSMSSSASSRRSDSALGFAMSQSISRGELTIPRTVPEEEYSSHESGQKYIISPHGAYSEYRSAKSFSTAGMLYSNFGEVSFQSDSKVPIEGHVPTVDTYALYEQKLNIENKIYSKNEKEIRIFESGACDGFSLINKELKEGERDVFSPLDKADSASWRIHIKEENGQELGIRTGIISCEPEEGEENYFFSSNGGDDDKFLGHGRLNYFLNKDYVTGVNGNVSQMVVYPDEKVELNLPKNLFEGDSVYYVERDVYVDSDVASQANYIEPEISQQNKLSANIKNDIHYLTQTFHQITKQRPLQSVLAEQMWSDLGYIDDPWDIHGSSPLIKKNYFNLQLKSKEYLSDTNSLEGCVNLVNPISTVNSEATLTIPESKSKREGWMLQRSEEKYFTSVPNDVSIISSAGATALGTSMTFTGLTIGYYYELQKKINGSWQTDLEPTTNHPNNKSDEESEITLTVTVGETYRLKEWQKQFSYGEVTVKTKTKIKIENVNVRYRLVKLTYTFENQQRLCNWIINKNTFTNSNMLHAEILKNKPIEADGGFNSTIVGYWDLVDWLYDTSDIARNDEGYMALRYKDFISEAAYRQPSNPHITRNMEGTPFRSMQDFKRLDAFEYELNDVRLPYYLEAKAGNEENKIREKGGVPIDGEFEYSYSDFSRLRVTRYVYRVYKKNAVLLGDLVKRDGERDYGGWSFGLEKSVKADGVWGSWQSANILSERKISSDYYAAAQLNIPYYCKGFDKVDSGALGFDSGSLLDATMIETDETANYEPKDIRFRINKEQIIETNNECKVQSKYNFFPVNLSWDYLDGAVNLTEGLTWDTKGYEEITLSDTDTYSYAIVKAADEDVQLINSDNEIKIYRMKEEEITADQYTSPFECRVVGGEWKNDACMMKVMRKDTGTQLKEDEPTLIEGVTELKIISNKTTGSIVTKIKRLPLSYTIKQSATVNGVEKVTYEQEVHGHNINSVRVGESGDEIYTLASDFECMNDSSALVSYEVTANIDDTSEEVSSAVVEQDDDFYNPPFQTSDFTVSGDNNIGGVFVCSGQSAMTVTANTDRTFHIVNAPGAQTVTVKDIGGSSISTLTAGRGAEITNKAQVAVKDVTKLTQASSQNNAVLSDYSKIIGQANFKLIEDENIYLEHSDDNEQIVFDCLSKVNLPKQTSPPTAFSFTGINIAMEPVPLVSPDNYLIDGELVHYIKPRSEVRLSYTDNAFSVETLDLESQASKLNVNQSKAAASQVNKYDIEDGGANIKGIYVTDKPSLKVNLPPEGLTNGFKHAFVIKENDPYLPGNSIVFKDSAGNEIGSHFNKYGVILKRVDGEYVFESITAPRPRLGKSKEQVNDSSGPIYSVEELANVVVYDKGKDWNDIYKDFLKLNFLKLTPNTPEIVEYDVSTFVGSGLNFYIKNETKEIKLIKFFNRDKQLDFRDDTEYERNTVPVESLGVTKVIFDEGDNSFISYGQKKPVTKTMSANKIGDKWLTDVEDGVLKFDDKTPVKGLLDDGNGSGRDYYFSTSKINGDRLVLPASAFEGVFVDPVVKFSSDDDFRVMVIPDSPPHENMLDWGGNEHEYAVYDEVYHTKDERYILDYSEASDGLKVYTIPLFPSVNRTFQHDPKVIHRGKELPHSSFSASAFDPSFEDLDDLDPSQEVLLATSMTFSFEISGGVITATTLPGVTLNQDDGEGGEDTDIDYVVTSEEKIVRIVDERIKTVDLTGVTTPTILIIYELPDEVDQTSISVLTDSSNSTDMTRRSAMRAVYNSSGSGSYALTEVQFYEISYHATEKGGYRELNKFYDKSDYDGNGSVLLFNTSVKIEEIDGGSDAVKWIDRNKHMCTDAGVSQITYAYSTDPSNGEYSILDSPLYIKNLPSNGYVINKSNNVIGAGEGVLYSDEVWHEGIEVDGYLPSPNLRSEDYFIKLHNHTVTPRASYYKGQEEQREIVNFCRLNKLSPKTLIYKRLDGVLYNIKNETLGEDWPDVEPYEYGITLYGNQLNSSKKINFEFYYDDLWNGGKVYNDLIYGKRIPSRALANTIGFSANTGNESIIKCIFFNERTGEVTFSGIKKDEEHVVIAVNHRSSTNAMDTVAYQEEDLEEVIPYVEYNGKKYFNGETFIGEGDVSTYSISSLDFTNVKVSLLSDLIEKEEGEDGSLVKVDPIVHPEAETTIVGDKVVAEPAWRAMPDDDKTITAVENMDTDDGSYQDGAPDIVVDNVTSTAAVGDVYLFSGGISFAIDMIAETDPPSSRQTLYGTLIGGDLASGAIGTYNPSKEIKESNRWGTVIKSAEMLKGYRWSNFLISHSFNHSKVQELIVGDKDGYYFITIKKQSGETYSPQITDTTGLIKTAEDSDNLYILRRATKDDPPFDRHDKIEGIELDDPVVLSPDLPDTIARVKIGKKDVFVPDDNYPVITTDNQAFKEDISISEVRAAKESRRAAAAGLKTDLYQTEITPKVMVVSAEQVLDKKNQFYEDVALNPTKNYANQVGLPGGIIFYLKEENLATDKLRVRLSRLVGKRIILKDYSSSTRIKNLKDNKIEHQLKYILEGELKSAYAYDEMVYKGTVKIGSTLWKLSDITIGTNIITADGLRDGDAIVFSVWSGSNTDLQINKVYFIKSTGVTNTYNLYRAKRLTANFKETFSAPTAAEFRVVNKAIPSPEFCAIGSIPDYVIVNKTCFRNHTLSGGTFIKLGLETYSFEYREDLTDEGNQGGPVSVDYVDDIFDSRNNLVRNWYVIKYHKNNKKTVVLHLTKGRTYRYFIKENVDKIIYGPNAGDKLDSETDPVLGTKGTFEAKQEKVEIVFSIDTEIKSTVEVGLDAKASGDDPDPEKTKEIAEEAGAKEIGWVGNINAEMYNTYGSLVKNGTFENVKLSSILDYNNDEIKIETEVRATVIVKDHFISKIKITNRGSADWLRRNPDDWSQVGEGTGWEVGDWLIIAYEAAETIDGNPNPNNAIYGGVEPDYSGNSWEVTMELITPWGVEQEPGRQVAKLAATTVEDENEGDINTDTSKPHLDFSENISLSICILEELKYEETNKDLPCKPHGEGPSKIVASSYEVDDKGIHGIFKSKSNTGAGSGMDDVLLDWSGTDPILKKILPAEIDAIHPHVKLIEGGDNVRLSWTMGDKYWDGFWFNKQKYLPQSYKYEIYRTKRELEDKDQLIDDGIAETYSYPDVTADVNLYKTKIISVGSIVSAGSHTYVDPGDGGPHLIENVILSGGSTWVASSPRAVATVEILSDFTIGDVTITDGGEGYAKGEKLTIPALKTSTSRGIGGADATCVVTAVEAVDLDDPSSDNRIKLDELGGEVKYDRDSLRYTLKSNRNGTLEYIPGPNEKHLLYNRKRYSSKAFLPYYKKEKIQVIAKDLEPFQRRIFDTTDYESGDTFYVKVSKELLRVVGDTLSTDEDLTSDPMRLPLNWVSSFSESDIKDSQKFRDVRNDIDKVRLEVVANSDNKGIELPELILQVVTARDDSGNAIRTPLPNWESQTDRDYTEMIRNLFFKMTFTSAKVCIYDPIVEGRVSNVRLLNNGENYLSEPTVTFAAPTAGYEIDDGTGKGIPFHKQSEGIAKLDTQGRINKIIITDPGSGYGWKEGGYQYEKTDVQPIAYSLIKIKSGAIPSGGYITGAGTFLNEKFFSYGYQLANGTNRKIDPVSVVVTANPEDALSNTLSMGMTREEFSFVNNIFSKENSVQSENEELYTASEMSGESFIGGSPKSANAEIPEGGHQDDINNLTEDPASHGFINVTPDEEGGRGQEEDADAVLDISPQGTSKLDNRGTDPTSSETAAKALGIVNDVSLADYRVKRRPFSKASYPWISGMSSSTRPDYPMFFGNAPSTEISADAFNNMVDAANSLNKVNIDLPIYVRIKKHREVTYRHVPDWGLRSKSTIDKINKYFEDNPLTEHVQPTSSQWVEYPEVPIVLKENDIICGTTNEDGTDIITGGTRINNYKAELYFGVDLPFYELDLDSVNERRIATSITAGTLIGSFSDPPEIYIKEINSINSLELYSECSHKLIYGCYSKADSVHQLFIETTLIWCEYEILPFGAYAEAALGKDLLSSLDKNKTIYEGVFTSRESSCSWGPSPRVKGVVADQYGNDRQFNVCPHGGILGPVFLSVDAGTVRSGPIETDSDKENTSVTVEANGIIKIDPIAEVGGLINGMYGSISKGVRDQEAPASCFNTCSPWKEIWLTFPRGKNNGFILNLDITKTDGADCF